jgi:hypothetical protein
MTSKNVLLTLASLGALGAVVYVLLVRTGWIPAPGYVLNELDGLMDRLEPDHEETTS